jgi:two-component system sensor histidine kinase/response regulator
MKVLIIEDDNGLAELIKEKVEAAGYKSASVQTAGEAIKWLAENTPHLMILDYSLPDMNSNEFIGALQNREQAIPPFIVSTGQGDEHIAVEMMKLGAKEYLIKNRHFLEILPEVIKKVSKEIEIEFKLKQAEEMLRLSNLRNIAMISNISDVIGIIGADGLMKYKSPNIEKWFGWQPQDLIGTDGWPTVHPDDLERIQKEFFLLLEKDNSVKTVEYRYKCKNGSYKPIELTATNLVNDQVIGGVLLNYHDITKRKHGEEALKESEERFKALHNASFGGIAIHDKGLILECNLGLSEMSGYSVDELIGMDGLLLIAEEAREIVMSNILSSDEKPYEVIGQRKNGEKYPLRLESRMIPYKGKQVRVVEFRDITDLKQAEIALIEKSNILKKTLHLSYDLINTKPGDINFGEITDNIREISGAKYAVCNIFEENGLDFTTVALSGIKDKFLNASSFLGFEIINKKWKHDAARANKIKGNIITKFDSLHELTGTVISNEVSSLIEKTFDLGNTYVVKINKEDKTIGDFTLLFSSENEIQNIELVELFANQIGLLMERKQAEEKLRESELKYRTLVETMSDGIYRSTRDGKFIEVNPAMVRILGYDSIEELLAIDIKSELYFAEEERESADMEQKMEEMAVFRLRKKDGSEIWVEDHGRYVRDDAGNILYHEGALRDISERRRAEDQIRKLSTAVEQSPATVVITDLNGDIEYVNSKFTSTTGYSFDEVISKNPRILKSDETSSEEYKELWETICSGKEWRGEFHNKKKNGELYWEFASISPIRNDKGITTHFLAVKEDISERKRAEGLLRESEERYKLITQNTLDIIFMLDKTGKQLFFNESVEKILGYKQEELVGKSFTRFVPISELPKYLLQLKNVFLKKEIHNFISKIYHKNGDVIDVEINGRLVKHDEKLVALGTIKDISERIKAEIILKEKNEELSTINAEKDKFFTIIAHDLKSPFNSIIGFSDLLIEQIHNKDYRGIEESAEIIQQSSNRAMDLLMNLMEWSQSQTGRIEFTPKTLEVVSLINEIALLFDDIAGQKSITIKRSLPPNALVVADKAMISTVLRNLISNAIKFSYPDGEIVISAKEIKNELTVSVTDNGVGISKASINELFRIDKNHSTQGTLNEKGTGLGLLLCKEFVEKHGGKIWIESEEGIGSTFYFTLPYNAELEEKNIVGNVVQE